jgi:hypothetical protein
VLIGSNTEIGGLRKFSSSGTFFFETCCLARSIDFIGMIIGHVHMSACIFENFKIFLAGNSNFGGKFKNLKKRLNT